MINKTPELFGFILGILAWVISAFISYELIHPVEFGDALMFLFCFFVIGKVVDMLFVYTISKLFSSDIDYSKTMKSIKKVGYVAIALVAIAIIANIVEHEYTRIENERNRVTTRSIRYVESEDVRQLKIYLKDNGFKKVDFNDEIFTNCCWRFLSSKSYTNEEIELFIQRNKEIQNTSTAHVGKK